MITNRKAEVILVNAEKIFWTHIDVNLFKKRFQENGFDLLMLKELNQDSCLNQRIRNDLNPKEIYRGIKLYNVCLYNICNELGIFKNELCFDNHYEIISKWYSLAKKTIDYLEKIFIEKKVLGAIVFHGHLLFDACLLAVCKLYRVRFLTLEITSNRNRLVWDNLSGYVVSYNLARNYFYKHIDENIDEVIDSYSKKYLTKIDSYKSYEHASTTQNKSTLIFKDQPFVLYLCQVYNDASQLFTFENSLVNPVDVINEASRISKSLGINLVIKIHPKEIVGKNPVTRKSYNQPTFNRIKDLESEKHIFIDVNNEFNTYELIKNSVSVITVNSQAGLEAALYNKPVLSYYKGFYSGLGFTNDYSDIKDLELKLKFIVKNDIKKNKNLLAAQSFFYTFNEHYCIKKSEKSLFEKIVEVFYLEKSVLFKIYNSIRKATYPLRRRFIKITSSWKR